MIGKLAFIPGIVHEFNLVEVRFFFSFCTVYYHVLGLCSVYINIHSVCNIHVFAKQGGGIWTMFMFISLSIHALN